MSTASGPLSTLPWPSATLPRTITFPGTVFPTTSMTMSTSAPVVTTSRTSIFSSSTTSFTTTETGGQSSSTGTTSAISTPSETRSTRTISTSSSPSTRLSSASSTLQSASLTRTASSSTVTPSASTTLIRGTLAPSDDSDGGGANGPTVAAAQQEISRLKETRTIVIAVLSALALVAVLVAARAVYLRRRGYSNTHRPPPTPLPQHKSPAGPLLTADTPMGGTTHGAPWPFLAVPEWHPNRLAPPPPRPPQPQPYRNMHMHMQHPQRASILPQTLDAWIAGAGSSSVDLRSVSQPATPSPHVRHEYKQGYI